MAKIVVLFASTEGQTAKIARVIAEHLRAGMQEVHVLDVAGSDPVDLSEYDGAILGGSIHLGEVQEPLRDFVKANIDRLETMPAAFFMVCLTAASKAPDAEDRVVALVNQFVDDTDWDPDQVAVFPGALKYSDYGFLKKLVMRRIAKRETGDTDTSRDYEYTRWSSVAHFADLFVASLPQAA